MKPMSQRVYALAAVALAIVLFMAVNIVSNQWLGTARLDLTDNNLFTVSPGTASTVSKLQEPVTLRFYFSRDPSSGYASIVAYAGRVRDLLKEYAALSRGKLIVEEIDPAPFTPAEDEAVSQGLTGAPTPEGENVYFGLVGSNTLAGREVIPFFDQSREEYLEYDLSSMVYKLSLPQKPKIGIMSSLPLEVGAGGLQAALAGNSQPYVIYTQLRDNFDIQMLDPMTADRVPAEISTLLVVHPANFSTAAQYAIDQFVMRGGHAIVFVDPLSESSTQQGPLAGADPADKMTSSLPALFTAWGVDFDSTKVVTDADLAQPVQTGGAGGQPQVISYIAWLRMTPLNFNTSDPLTANLQLLNVPSAGALKAHAGATTKFLPLLTSSSNAALIDSAQVRAVQNPSDLLRRFAPTGEKYVLGARVSGPTKTAFPNGAPPALPKAPDAADAAKPDSGPLPAPIAESKDINVIIVADADLFEDRFWVQVQNMLGQRIAVPSADNGALVMNAVENMMGSNDLISLRTRERSARPFVVVDQIRRDAESRFLAEEQALQQKVTATEASLRQLQGQNTQGQNANSLVLSKEQQAQVDKFRRDLVTTRASLRQVQVSLRENVEALGTAVAVLNIALVPILIGAAAIGLSFLRRRRRASARGM